MKGDAGSMTLFNREYKQVAAGTGVIGLLATLIALPLGAFTREWVLGLILGTVYTLLNFRMLAIAVVKAVYRPPHKAKTYMKVQYLIRYTLTGIVLTLGFAAPYLNPIAVAAPMLAPRFSLMACGIFGKEGRNCERS